MDRVYPKLGEATRGTEIVSLPLILEGAVAGCTVIPQTGSMAPGRAGACCIIGRGFLVVGLGELAGCGDNANSGSALNRSRQDRPQK